MTTADLEAFRAWLKSRLGGASVRAGPMPDGADIPDRLVSVQTYDGPETPNWRADDRLQIRIRGDHEAAGVSPYASCYTLLDLVIAAVAPPQDNPLVVILAGGRRAILRKLNGPHPLGLDPKSRWEMTINVGLDYARV